MYITFFFIYIFTFTLPGEKKKQTKPESFFNAERSKEENFYFIFVKVTSPKGAP